MITNIIQRSRTCKFFILALTQCLKLPRTDHENTIYCKTCSSNDRQRLSKNRGRGRNLSDYIIMATSRGSDHENTKARSQARFLETFIFVQDHLNQQKFNRNFETFYKISLGK